MPDLDAENPVENRNNLPDVLPNKKPDKALYVPPARRSTGDDLSNNMSGTASSVKSNLSQRSKSVRKKREMELLETSIEALRLSEPTPEKTLTLSPTDSKTLLGRNSSQSSFESSIDYSKFLHVLELYDFPKDIDSADLQAELVGFEDSGFYLKWVDDTHCLAVFSSPTEAERALKQISGIVFKARRFEEACIDSKRKLAKSPGDWAMPFKRRPPTTTTTAHRLISRHLGLKSPNTEKSARRLSQEKQDLQALAEARAKHEACRQARKAIWEDESFDFPN